VRLVPPATFARGGTGPHRYALGHPFTVLAADSFSWLLAC